MKLRNYIVLMCLALAMQGYSQEEINVKVLTYKNGIFYKVGSTTPFTGKAIAYGDKGKIVTETSYVNGKKEGAFKKYHQNGVLEEEGSYKQKKKEGEFKSYYSSGKPNTVENYVDGKREGIVKEYYDSGQLKSESQYKNDQKDGKASLYYSNGQLKVSLTYKEGREDEYDKVYSAAGETFLEIIGDRNSAFVVKYYGYNGLPIKEEAYQATSGEEEKGEKVGYKLYYDSGQLKEETSYRDGKRNGKRTTYYENGGVESREIYKDDVLEGKSDYYTAFGARILSKNFTSNIASVYNMSSGEVIKQLPFEEDDNMEVFSSLMDMQIEGGEFYDVGKFYVLGNSKERILLNGKYKMTYPNSQVAFDYEFMDGRPVAGTFVWYRDTGKKYAEVKYLKGGMRTEVKLYYVDGTLQASFNTQEGNYQGNYLTYSPKGVLISDIRYYYGGITGVAFQYYSDGKLMMAVNYEQGEKQGPYEIYYKEGMLMEEGVYDEEGYQEVLFTYDKKGNKIGSVH
ncbi:MAG: hypothetical protein LBI72_07620 [Flavobacteriaceae bacterium]|jgi:antitoxin component YwqK of YwqJK toxin-antitoxin module|nr:hypothetical protein [Flavobacteriaceae bacterium]